MIYAYMTFKLTHIDKTKASFNKAIDLEITARTNYFNKILLKMQTRFCDIYNTKDIVYDGEQQETSSDTKKKTLKVQS